MAQAPESHVQGSETQDNDLESIAGAFGLARFVVRPEDRIDIGNPYSRFRPGEYYSVPFTISLPPLSQRLLPADVVLNAWQFLNALRDERIREAFQGDSGLSYALWGVQSPQVIAVLKTGRPVMRIVPTVIAFFDHAGYHHAQTEGLDVLLPWAAPPDDVLKYAIGLHKTYGPQLVPLNIPGRLQSMAESILKQPGSG